MATTEDRIYLADLETRLGRTAHTIRQWLRAPNFPAELQPGREGGRAKLFWEPHQLAGLDKYADERAAERGWKSGSESVREARMSRRTAGA